MEIAVNPDPDAETLADIAIQSADSAERFGIPARVAMISYSTGSRGLERMLTKCGRRRDSRRPKQPDCSSMGRCGDAATMADVAATKHLTVL